LKNSHFRNNNRVIRTESQSDHLDTYYYEDNNLNLNTIFKEYIYNDKILENFNSNKSENVNFLNLLTCDKSKTSTIDSLHSRMNYNIKELAENSYYSREYSNFKNFENFNEKNLLIEEKLGYLKNKINLSLNFNKNLNNNNLVKNLNHDKNESKANHDPYLFDFTRTFDLKKNDLVLDKLNFGENQNLKNNRFKKEIENYEKNSCTIYESCRSNSNSILDSKLEEDRSDEDSCKMNNYKIFKNEKIPTKNHSEIEYEINVLNMVKKNNEIKTKILDLNLNFFKIKGKSKALKIKNVIYPFFENNIIKNLNIFN